MSFYKNFDYVSCSSSWFNDPGINYFFINIIITREIVCNRKKNSANKVLLFSYLSILYFRFPVFCGCLLLAILLKVWAKVL